MVDSPLTQDELNDIPEPSQVQHLKEEMVLGLLQGLQNARIMPLGLLTTILDKDNIKLGYFHLDCPQSGSRTSITGSKPESNRRFTVQSGKSSNLNLIDRSMFGD